MKYGVITPDGSVRIVPMMEWAEWFERSMSTDSYKDGGRVVAQTELPGSVLVSTVFLGIDHNFTGRGAPRWFETMVFGGTHDDYQSRCCTFEEAETDHARAVALAKGGM